MSTAFSDWGRSPSASTGIDTGHARALAETVHRGQRDSGGALLLDHIRRVVTAVSGTARVVAWLHEVFEYTTISEEALLAEGLTPDELRALRLLARGEDSRSDQIYLAHVELIAHARGPGASLAQTVKRADLADRLLHPAIRADGWAPPYEVALEVMRRGVVSLPSNRGIDERRTVAGLRRGTRRRERDGGAGEFVRLPRSLEAAEREAIERDIHDGVQQRLTALRLPPGAP